MRLISKQAFEDIQIQIIKSIGISDRIILSEIPVNSIERGCRYTLEAIKNSSLLLMSTDYPCDTLPVKGIWSSLEGVRPRGEHVSLVIGAPYLSGGIDVRLSSLDAKIHNTRGTVWRFKGMFQYFNGYTINGSYNDPLSFYLVENIGAVYLHGKGTVKNKNGKIILNK